MATAHCWKDGAFGFAAPSRVSASGRGSIARRGWPASPAASATTRRASRSTRSATKRRSSSSSTRCNFPHPLREFSHSTQTGIDAEPAAAFDIVDSERGRRPARLDSARPGDLRRMPRRDLRSGRTAATATRSRTARTAGRASRSRPTSRTTARATTMAPFEMCPALPARIRGRRRSAVSRAAERVSGVRPAARRCARRRRAASTLTMRSRGRAGARRRVSSSRSRASAGFTWRATRRREAAVRLLRERKRRDEKPLAVMVRSLRDAADALAVVGDEERRLLTSVERPIVLLPKRPGEPRSPKRRAATTR